MTFLTSRSLLRNCPANCQLGNSLSRVWFEIPTASEPRMIFNQNFIEKTVFKIAVESSDITHIPFENGLADRIHSKAMVGKTWGLIGRH